MSRAFVKEDVDVPEPSGRRRSASGLPPGALNLMTLDGAERLRARLLELKSTQSLHDEIDHLERVLGSMTIVPSQPSPEAVVFGARVTLMNSAGDSASYRIVGVDETSLDPRHVSWVSAKGRILLGAVPGQRLRLEDGSTLWWTVVRVEEGR